MTARLISQLYSRIPRIARFACLACALAIGGGLVYSQAASTWDSGDLFIGFDNEFDAGDLNPSHFAVLDPTTGAQKDDVSQVDFPSFAGACMLDATSPNVDLWTVGFWDNKVRQFSGAMPHVPLMTLDMRTLTGGTPAQSAAVTSIVFGTNNDFYVASTYGTPQIYHYNKPATPGAAPIPVEPPFSVDISDPTGGYRGVDWIDLSADQKTLFYSSIDNSGRAPAEIRTYDLVNHQQGPTILLKAGSANLATFVYSFRVLPPGDGSGGFIVSTDLDVFQVGPTGQAIRGFTQSSDFVQQMTQRGLPTSYNTFIDVNITNDGQYFWTAAYPQTGPILDALGNPLLDALGNELTQVVVPGKVFKFHIPTGTVQAGPFDLGVVGAEEFSNAVCLKREYVAATEQPLVQCPGDYRCSPPPTCPGPSPYCAVPGAPVITALVDGQSGNTYTNPAATTTVTNRENDTVNLTVQATSGLSNPAVTYLITGLPKGLTYNATTGVITGVITYDAAGICGASCQVSVIVTSTSGRSTSTVFQWRVNELDAPPVIASIPNQTSQHGRAITAIPLSATDYDDSDATIFSMLLPQPVIPGLTFSAATVGTRTPVGLTRTATITGAPGLQSGVQCPGGTCPPISVTILADDNAGHNPPNPSQLATFTWTLLNQSPTVTKPAAQSSPFNVAVTPLAVVASDPNGDALTYSLATNPTGTGLVISSTGVITGTLPAINTYTVTVTADDGHGGTASQAFTWTATNTPPTIVAPSAQTSPVKVPVTPLQVSASDANGDTLTYSMTTSPTNSGLVISPTTGLITGTATTITTYTVTVTVNDGHTGGTASTTFPWVFTNTPPTMVQPPNQTSPVNVPVTPLQISASDANGDTLTYTLATSPTNSGLAISSTGLITGTPTTITTYQVTVTANDGHGGTVSKTFTWTVGNTPPVIVQPPDQTSPVGVAVTPLPISASDANHDTLTYSLATSPANSGLVISATTGIVTGTPTTLGAYQFTVTVTDGHGGTTSQTFVWTFVNTPPVLVQPSNQTSPVNAPVTPLQVSASDANHDTLTYTLATVPANSGLSISATGVITGTPVTVAAYQVTVTVSDGHGGTDSKTFTWTVANTPPTMVQPANQTSQLNVPVTPLQIAASDANGDTLTFSLVTTPANSGLTISAAGLITGTPTSLGAYQFVVTADDGHGGSISQTFTWTFVNQVQTSTTLTSSKNPSAQGQSVTLTATVSPTGSQYPTGTVTFKDGATSLATVAVNGSGQAAYVTSSLALGPHSITAVYNGGNGFVTSTSAVLNQIVFGYATGAGGGFVIGDLEAVVGNHVTFWGAQWAKINALSGGSAAPSSFKGFVDCTSTNPPAPGGTWTTNPGNSSNPPSTIPTYMALIVSSKITKSGSTIAGNIPTMVIVATDPGYAGNPGHAGTGTIVAVIH